VRPLSNIRRSTQSEKFEADPNFAWPSAKHREARIKLSLRREAMAATPHALARNRRQRVVLAWNPAIEQKSLNINKLEQVLVEKVGQFFDNDLF
jgi:hypothetical protein